MDEVRESTNEKPQKAQAAFGEFYPICFWFMRPELAVTVLLFVLPAVSALAKRGAPPTIEPVVHAGVRYVVPNETGLRAYVEAWDGQTGLKLWTKTVFRHWYIPIPFGRTESMHHEYIASVTRRDSLLTITSERGRQYVLDTRTRSIRRLRIGATKVNLSKS